MSLSPREQQALAQIERQLSRSDPGLAALLARWDGTGAGWRPAFMGGPRRPRTRELVRLSAVAAGLALLLGMVIVAVLSTHPVRSLGRGLQPAIRAATAYPGNPTSDNAYPASVYLGSPSPSPGSAYSASAYP